MTRQRRRMRAAFRRTPRRPQRMPTAPGPIWLPFRTSRREQLRRTRNALRRILSPPTLHARATVPTHCAVEPNQPQRRRGRRALRRHRHPRRRAIHRPRRLYLLTIHPLLPTIPHPRRVPRRHLRRPSRPRHLPLLVRNRRYRRAQAFRAHSRLLPMPRWASSLRRRHRSIRRFRNSWRSPSSRAIRKPRAMPASPLVRSHR